MKKECKCKDCEKRNFLIVMETLLKMDMKNIINYNHPKIKEWCLGIEKNNKLLK